MFAGLELSGQEEEAGSFAACRPRGGQRRQSWLPLGTSLREVELTRYATEPATHIALGINRRAWPGCDDSIRLNRAVQLERSEPGCRAGPANGPKHT
jgi:hypothetical protein